jgi:hypothetical protein
VHTAGTYDIPEEAGDAEAHIGGVAEDGQQNRCQTNSTAGQNNEPIYFFHSFSLSILILQDYPSIIGTFVSKSKFAFPMETMVLSIKSIISDCQKSMILSND